MCSTLMRRLVINCDDLGMHPSINRAVVQLLTKSKVSSASLMPNGQAFDDAVARLHGAGIRKVGVHLALGSEYPALPIGPVAPVASVPSLVNSAGHFLPNMTALRPKYKLADATRELRAQLARIDAAGLIPTHLDGHMFFYEVTEAGTTDLLHLVRTLAHERGIPWRDREAVRTYFIWEGYEGDVSRATYYRDLLTNFAEGTAELIIHPADDLEEIAVFTGAGRRRTADFHYFADPSWQHLAHATGIQIGDWSVLQRQQLRGTSFQRGLL